MNKELLQQALDALIESRDDVDLCYAGVKAARLSFRQERQLGFYEEQLIKHDAAIEALKQALAQQEQCGCREGECETKKDKTCRMTIEIAERDGIPEWTPAIGIECAISSLRDDAARLRDGSYTPLQIADDLNVIANDLGKCNPVAQQEQPASVDAYVGAREDAAIWKKRALEAEELNRKFIAEFNGPTYLGEPAQQEPLGEMLACDIDARPLNHPLRDYHTAPSAGPLNSTWQDKPHRLLYDLIAAVKYYAKAQQEQPAQEPVAYGRDDEMKAITALEKNAWISAGRARVVEAYTIPLYTHPAPTQPALSDEQILDIFSKVSADGMGHYMTAVGRAIEAHCRGEALVMNNQEFQERVVEILENLVSSMDQRDFGWVLRQVRNLYEDVREAAKQGGAK